MVIIETSIFTRRVQNLLTDEAYRQMQAMLVARPTTGVVIPGSGGTRVIYYWAVTHDQILMLFIFAKNERSDLTPSQLNVLRQIVKEEYP